MATAQPHPGIPVKPSLVAPAPGQVIVSYQIIEPETGCCKCNDLTGGGLALLIIGILIFWPIALIPCLMADCKTKSQMPVYGYPGGAAPPVAYPQYGQPVVVNVSQPAAHGYAQAPPPGSVPEGAKY